MLFSLQFRYFSRLILIEHLWWKISEKYLQYKWWCDVVMVIFVHNDKLPFMLHFYKKIPHSASLYSEISDDWELIRTTNKVSRWSRSSLDLTPQDSTAEHKGRPVVRTVTEVEGEMSTSYFICRKGSSLLSTVKCRNYFRTLTKTLKILRVISKNTLP